jgi:RNA polymerase sigma-70 factor (ECF subfamily)
MRASVEEVIPHERASNAENPGAAQESAWIAASQRGDVAAFNRLVLRWEKPIYNLSLRMLADPDDADDATQEVFLSAFRNIRRFRHDARFSTWLYRIAVNHCISRLRRRPPGAHYSLDDRSETAGPILDQLPARHSQEREMLVEESRSRVRRALEHLTPEQRAVVELKFFQELTFEEIAGVVQVPLSTIKSRLYSGLELLKTRLARLEREGPKADVWRSR